MNKRALRNDMFQHIAKLIEAFVDIGGTWNIASTDEEADFLRKALREEARRFADRSVRVKRKT